MLCLDAYYEILSFSDHLTLYNALCTSREICNITKETQLYKELCKVKTGKLTVKSLAEMGNLFVAKYLYSFSKINEKSFPPDLFSACCKAGHFETSKWLYSFGKYALGGDERIQHAFTNSCRNGHLNIAKWLYSLHIINIHLWDEEAFRFSCSDGTLEVAQWLYSLDLSSASSKSKIDIHIYDEFPFRKSCENGHLEVAKWLYSLGNVNIHASDNYAFKRWEYSHPEVVNWLKTL